MICGALGCRDPAEKRIRHPKHGPSVVCDDHVNGREILEDRRKARRSTASLIVGNG